MRVLLINPPLISTETISAAIPYLLASLEKNNIDTKVVDFNIEFLRYILSNDYLNYTKELLLKI